MNKIIKYLFGVVAGVAMLTSCSEDYLNTAPTDQVGTATAFETTANVANVINGMAEIMSTQHSYYGQGFNGEAYVMNRIGEYPGPYYVYAGMGSGWAPIFNMAWLDRDSQYIYYSWYYYYSLISNANDVIFNVDAAEGLEAEKQFLKAQALTYRAYSYWRLCTIHACRWIDSNNGEADGVVLRLDTNTGDCPLSSLKDCYDQIKKDLDDAVKLYDQSGMDRPAGAVWQPNKAVANAIWARAALETEDWATAATKAAEARAEYPLMDNAAYGAGFATPTSEWIWGSYGDASEQLYYYSYGTQYAYNGYYAGASNYGAGSIERNVINKIPDTDYRKNLFVHEGVFAAAGIDYETLLNDYCYADGLIEPYVYDDATGQPIAYNAAGKAALAHVNKYAGINTEENPAYYSDYMYVGAHLKFGVIAQPGVSYIPFIRSSEMYLIEAEAEYRKGASGAAAAQAALVALNKTSGRNPNYTCTKTGDELFEEIKLYRAFELWGEGFSWFDYKRWGLGFTRLAFGKGGSFNVANALEIKPDGCNNWVYKIPKLETDYNKGINANGTEAEE